MGFIFLCTIFLIRFCYFREKYYTERLSRGFIALPIILLSHIYGYSHLNKSISNCRHLSERVPFTTYSTESPSPKYIYINIHIPVNSSINMSVCTPSTLNTPAELYANIHTTQKSMKQLTLKSNHMAEREEMTDHLFIRPVTYATCVLYCWVGRNGVAGFGIYHVERERWKEKNWEKKDIFHIPKFHRISYHLHKYPHEPN